MPECSVEGGDWQVVVQPPSDDVLVAMDTEGDVEHSRIQNHELPSFSQVDMEVFDALPEDVRKELEAEYKRGSHSPAPIPLAGPSCRSEPKDLFAIPKITVKGTNVKHITQQLAPQTRSIISPKKHNIFRSGISISDEALRELDIDPEVFALLPEDMHCEQLALARQAKKSGGFSALVLESNREYHQIKASQRVSRSPSVQFRKKPPPKANHPEPVGIKRPGGRKGELLYFTDTEDIQKVIQSWVETYRQYAPMQKDVDKFAKFLVQSVDSNLSTDTGMEKAVVILKWWLVLLRRYWGIWEHAEDDKGDAAVETVGRAWWMAFRRVKEQVDLVARKKFGGCLSLR
jgi:DNA repair protein REV1